MEWSVPSIVSHHNAATIQSKSQCHKLTLIHWLLSNTTNQYVLAKSSLKFHKKLNSQQIYGTSNQQKSFNKITSHSPTPLLYEILNLAIIQNQWFFSALCWHLMLNLSQTSKCPSSVLKILPKCCCVWHNFYWKTDNSKSTDGQSALWEI